MAPEPQSPRDSTSRLERVTRVVDDAIDRRLAGENLPDDVVIAQHPELMPELGRRLRDISCVEQAARRAEEPLTTRNPCPGDLCLSAQLPQAGVFPGYEIIREIESGGQGVVYEAIQETTERHVAIKVIREGPFGSSRSRERFEREVQILAALHHPNIVTVHDSGTAVGCYYFVMDYIRGQSLDEYVQTRLITNGSNVLDDDESLKDLLATFAKACEAVNVAHLRGVIHRDLKPGNIRVDHSGEPHILDFGLAKAAEYDVLGGSGSDAVTQTGQFVGSLPWASPEQAEGRPDTLDIRTDIYSLGVILYQVLTGRFPYEVAGNLRDRLDAILQAEPVRPSTICRLIDDELETIVLKCLSKDRQRRYQTAGELARDMERYLAGEAIEAKRDSTLYVLRKQLRRYRGPIIVAGAFVLLLIGFSVSMTTLYLQSRVNLSRALRAEVTAGERAETAQRVSASLEILIRSLDPTEDSNLGISTDKTVSVTDLLDKCAEQIDTQLEGEPLAQARLMDVLGNVFRSQCQHDRALPLITRALETRRRELGDDHPDVAQSLASLAWIEAHRQKYTDAERQCTEALAILRDSGGPVQEEVEFILGYLATRYRDSRRFDEATRIVRKVVTLKRARLGNQHLDLTIALSGLGNWLKLTGDFRESEASHREAVSLLQETLGPGNQLTLDASYYLGSLLYYVGEYAEALEIYRHVYAGYTEVRDENDPKTLHSQQNVALMLGSLGRFEESLPLFQENYRRKCDIFGDQHASTIHTVSDWAKVLRAGGDLATAETKALTALGFFENETGRDREMLLGWAWLLVGRIHLDQNDIVQATSDAQMCIDHFREWAPEDNYHVALGKNLRGQCLLRLGRVDQAEPLLIESLSVISETYGPDNQRTLTARRLLNELADARDNPPAGNPNNP